MSRKAGTVKWYDVRKHYGFITPTDGSEDIFLHRTSFVAPEPSPASAARPQEDADADADADTPRRPRNPPRLFVKDGQEVEYEVGDKDGKAIALKVTQKGGEPLPVQKRRKTAPKKAAADGDEAVGKASKQPQAAAKGSLKLQGVSFKAFLDPRSTCSRRVLLALKEKEIPFELEIVDIVKGEQKSAEHLARHPFGKVPFLEITKKGKVYGLFESQAIIRYLAAFDSGKKLVPSDPWVAAMVDKMICLDSEYLDSASFDLYYQRVLRTRLDPKAPEDSKKVEESRAKTAKVLAVIENEMRRFVAGREFSLADVVLLPTIARIVAADCKDLLDACPKIGKWYEQASARPAWLAVLEETKKL